MSAITKQWLQQKIAEMESTRDEIPFGLDEDDSNTLAAMKLVLASLEAEPAIHRWRRVTVEPYGPYPWHYGNFIGFSKPVEGIEEEYFYSAPPATVSVPDELSREEYKRLFMEEDNFNDTFRGGWNACRAAMLHGAAGNSPVIPGGWVACSERMPEPEVDVQVYCSDKKEQMVGYLERNEREGCFRFATWRNGDGIYCQPTHWMPLPAAPHQEVK